MEVIFYGFLFVIVLETIIRVLSKHERALEKEQAQVRVSVPWYGWSLLGLLTWKSFTSDKKK